MTNPIDLSKGDSKRMLYGSLEDADLQRRIIMQSSESTYMYWLMKFEPIEEEV